MNCFTRWGPGKNRRLHGRSPVASSNFVGDIYLGSAGVRRWEFEKGGESLTVGVHGPLILDDMDVAIRAAMDAVGLAFSLEEYVAPQIASGALVRELRDWCEPFGGFFLYSPSRRQQPAALAALIDTLRVSAN